jgi:hypothetical protein
METRNLAVLTMLVTVALTPSVRAALPYGPDTCRQGYVWRDAFQGDHVCVTPATRTEAAVANREAGAHRQPGGGAYGPDTCQQGYVWREAHPQDHVCVTPATRAQTADDNRQAAARRAQDRGGVPIDPGTQLNPASN